MHQNCTAETFYDSHQAKIQLPHPFDIIVKKFLTFKIRMEGGGRSAVSVTRF